MMTTNKLTKTFASGSLAIGVLAGSVLTATSASAAMLTWAAWTSGTPLIEGDKKVTYVSGSIGADDLDDVALIEMGGHYYFLYDAMNGPAMVNANSGSFTYTIEATTPGWYIVGLDLDSNVSSNYGTVTETLAEIPGLELISTNGSPVPDSGFIGIARYKLLTITNTLNNTGGPTEGLIDFQNSFRQEYVPPVPEPGTVLGLLAVGGLGLVSRFKKQK
ncbi:PEP-CTERM sorting domain-containing protein [Microcystis aeruginosa KW]|uniref:PEP-CTERM sorting domain-containing protein n=1 Tax=Microcystis aeruginosa KW TaxID=1960155 RepID=A0A1V4BQT1_MICAE|nr:PEP-CTERM sorting domain-containing protein [Microcystis aeruginosa]OPF16796.1 PEP-CTERM sorting domain-containing protein [Microcystis aeruginosa KW]